MTMKIAAEQLEVEFKELIEAVRENGHNLKIIQFESNTFLGMDYSEGMLLLVLRKNEEFYSMNTVYVDLTDNVLGEFFSIGEILNQDVKTIVKEINNAFEKVNKAGIVIKNILKRTNNTHGGL